MIQETQYQQAKSRLAELLAEKVKLEDERKRELADIISKYGDFEFEVLSVSNKGAELRLVKFGHEPYDLSIEVTRGDVFVHFGYLRSVHVGEYSPRTEALRMALAIASDGDELVEFLKRDDGGKMVSLANEMAECNGVIWEYEDQEKRAAMARIEATIKPNGKMGIAFFKTSVVGNDFKGGILVSKVTKKRIYGYYIYRDDRSPDKVSRIDSYYAKERQWDKETILTQIMNGKNEVVDDIRAEIAK